MIRYVFVHFNEACVNIKNFFDILFTIKVKASLKLNIT